MNNTSDFNLQKINTKELADNISATIDFGGNILAIARRGTGKTTIAKKIIKQQKYKEVYMNLSLMERPDIGGYPNFFGSKNGEKFINFLMPSIYKDLIDGDEKCVAILDEVDKADTSLLAPLLEIIQFRSVNGYKLKNLHSIIMTANLQAEGGSRPPLPLLDRTEKFIVEVSPKHWLDWGGESGEIHPSVSAYISDNLEDLCGDIEPGPENYADPSPRSWHSVSRLLFYGEKNNWPSSMMMHKVSGCVGKKIGSKYSAFFEYYKELLPTVQKIIAGEKFPEFSKFETTKQLVVTMIACSRLALSLDSTKNSKDENSNFTLNEDSQRISDNLVKFLSNIDPEMALVSIRSQLSISRISQFGLLDDKNWSILLDQFINKIEMTGKN